MKVKVFVPQCTAFTLFFLNLVFFLKVAPADMTFFAGIKFSSSLVVDLCLFYNRITFNALSTVIYRVWGSGLAWLSMSFPD